MMPCVRPFATSGNININVIFICGSIYIYINRDGY
jgi:hypothetical protein